AGACTVEGGGDVLRVGGHEGPRGGRPHGEAGHVDAVRVDLALGDPAVDDALDGGDVGLETRGAGHQDVRGELGLGLGLGPHGATVAEPGGVVVVPTLSATVEVDDEGQRLVDLVVEEVGVLHPLRAGGVLVLVQHRAHDAGLLERGGCDRRAVDGGDRITLVGHGVLSLEIEAAVTGGAAVAPSDVCEVQHDVATLVGGVTPVLDLAEVHVGDLSGGACQMVCVRGGSPYERKHTVGDRQGDASGASGGSGGGRAASGRVGGDG